MGDDTGSGLSKFVAKLERRKPLPREERDAFLALPYVRRDYEAHQDIINEGDLSTRCILIEAGLVSRKKTLANGARQIVAFGLPGDFVDLQNVLFDVTDHGIEANSDTTTVSVSNRDILAIAAEYPVLGRALWRDTLIDAAIFRVWMANVGQRKARERMTHLLLELAARHEAISAYHDRRYNLPLTQADFGEALGLSIVHVNRSFQWLRREGHISTSGRVITIENPIAMQALSGFDNKYLHL